MAAPLLPIVFNISFERMGLRAKARALTGAVDPASARFVSDAIAKVSPDVVHLEGGGLAAVLRSAIAGFAGEFSACTTRRRCATRSSPATPPGRESGFVSSCCRLLARRQERRWFRYADRVVVTSPYRCAGAVAPGLKPGAVAAIPNGVDLEYFAHRPASQAGPNRLHRQHELAAE